MLEANATGCLFTHCCRTERTPPLPTPFHIFHPPAHSISLTLLLMTQKRGPVEITRSSQSPPHHKSNMQNKFPAAVCIYPHTALNPAWQEREQSVRMAEISWTLQVFGFFFLFFRAEYQNPCTFSYSLPAAPVFTPALTQLRVSLSVPQEACVVFKYYCHHSRCSLSHRLPPMCSYYVGDTELVDALSS